MNFVTFHTSRAGCLPWEWDLSTCLTLGKKTDHLSVSYSFKSLNPTTKSSDEHNLSVTSREIVYLASIPLWSPLLRKTVALCALKENIFFSEIRRA